VHSFPRPEQRYLDAVRQPVPGTCPECGAAEMEEYRVLSEGGWWDVRKCRACLACAQREAAPPYGSYTPLGLEIGP
jgi:hypothetical protein